jgi:hypothetical protein
MKRIKMKMKVIWKLVRYTFTGALDLPYLHAILQLRYNGAFRDEHEELAAPCEWERDDERKEDGHLSHQEEEDLDKKQK